MSNTIPREYDAQGIRKLQTGAERKLPCGRTVQMHAKDPAWMGELIAALEGVPGVGRG